MENIVTAVEVEAKKIEGEVAAEVKNVEAKVETTVTAVETKIEAEAQLVEGEVKKVEAAVVKYATEARIAVTAEENLALTKMENMFLKGQMEIRRLTDEAKMVGEQYPKQVEALAKKYLINPLTHAYNAIEGAFVKKA